MSSALPNSALLNPDCGLYAITPDWNDTSRLLAAVTEVLSSGTTALQYRNKKADAALGLSQAQALRDLCRQHQTAFIVNDDIELAIAVHADGVHLGGEDGDLAAARRKLGPDFILGASCYNELDLGRKALAAGASYIAFGAIFPSNTKPNARAASLTLLMQARAAFSCPIVAIGGITPQNAAQVYAAGADHIAVISSLFESETIGQTALQFHK